MSAATTAAPYGIATWGMQSWYLASYQPAAYRNFVTQTFSYIPCVFLFYTIYRERALWRAYKWNIYFSSFTQLGFELPLYGLHIVLIFWIADQDQETTLFLCIFGKTLINMFMANAYQVYLAVAIKRYLSLIWQRDFNCEWWLLIVLNVPNIYYYGILRPFFGPLTTNDVCSPILGDTTSWGLTAYSIYISASILIATLINLRIAMFVRAYQKRKKQMGLKISKEELGISWGLCLQSFVPFVVQTLQQMSVLSLTWNRTNPNAFYLPVWVVTLVQILGYARTGLNTILSIMFMKSYRLMFFELMSCFQYKKKREFSTLLKSKVEEQSVVVRPTLT